MRLCSYSDVISITKVLKVLRKIVLKPITISFIFFYSFLKIVIEASPMSNLFLNLIKNLDLVGSSSYIRITKKPSFS